MCTTVHQIEKKKKKQYLFQYSTKVNKNSINQPNYEPIDAGHVCPIQELNSADIYIISTSEKFQVKTILNNSQQTPYKLKAQKNHKCTSKLQNPPCNSQDSFNNEKDLHQSIVNYQKEKVNAGILEHCFKKSGNK